MLSASNKFQGATTGTASQMNQSKSKERNQFFNMPVGATTIYSARNREATNENKILVVNKEKKHVAAGGGN